MEAACALGSGGGEGGDDGGGSSGGSQCQPPEAVVQLRGLIVYAAERRVAAEGRERHEERRRDGEERRAVADVAARRESAHSGSRGAAWDGEEARGDVVVDEGAAGDGELEGIEDAVLVRPAAVRVRHGVAGKGGLAAAGMPDAERAEDEDKAGREGEKREPVYAGHGSEEAEKNRR
jgi:hypothetical protein